MIIKKKYAQNVLQSQHKATSSPSSQPNPPQDNHEVDPYTLGPLSEEDFLSGRLADRRKGSRQERRAGFRRIEDQELITQAQEEANAIREAAAEEGFQQGLQQAEETIAALSHAIDNLMTAQEAVYASVEKELAAMALEIAERIIKTEVSCDEALVMSVVRNTVAKVGRDQKSILIKVNPVDLKLVKETMKVDSQLSGSVEVLVTEDQEVDQGSCIVETRAGQIDARFSTQLAILKHLLQVGGSA